MHRLNSHAWIDGPRRSGLYDLPEHQHRDNPARLLFQIQKQVKIYACPGSNGRVISRKKDFYRLPRPPVSQISGQMHGGS